MIKIIKILTLVCLTLVCLTAFAQKPKWEKENFQVWGNCDMCKTKIEKAATGVEGVKTARWNVVNKKMKIKFNPAITYCPNLCIAITTSLPNSPEPNNSILFLIAQK